MENPGMTLEEFLTDLNLVREKVGGSVLDGQVVVPFTPDAVLSAYAYWRGLNRLAGMNHPFAQLMMGNMGQNVELVENDEVDHGPQDMDDVSEIEI